MLIRHNFELNINSRILLFNRMIDVKDLGFKKDKSVDKLRSLLKII
jgi:hypothetical protein